LTVLVAIVLLGTDYQGWFTAIGTAVAGLAALFALVFGAMQFRKGGFVHRCYASIALDHQAIRLAVENRGRITGTIQYVEVLNRRSLFARARRMLALRRTVELEVIEAELWGDTHLGRVPTGDVTIPVPANEAIVAYLVRPDGTDGQGNVMLQPFIGSDPQLAKSRRQLLVTVKFGNGRRALRVPRPERGTFEVPRSV
jgi:hypothetical protein